MKISTLGYALLGLLARASSSGYDLGRQLKEPIGFYWQARYSQIYPELAKLEDAGLVTFEVVAQQDLPAKKVYTITEQGRAALSAWVTMPAELSVLRDELILKTFSFWLADPQQASVLVQTHLEQHLQQLHKYEEFEQEFQEYAEELADSGSPRFSFYATLKAGLIYERAYTDWCRWLIDRLQQDGEAADTSGGRQDASQPNCFTTHGAEEQD